jgi:hypothetical protein
LALTHRTLALLVNTGRNPLHLFVSGDPMGLQKWERYVVSYRHASGALVLADFSCFFLQFMVVCFVFSTISLNLSLAAMYHLFSGARA